MADWTGALCRGKTDLWFPSESVPGVFGAESRYQVTRAVETCRGCPCYTPCREAGRWEQYGIWGGTGWKERKHDRATALALRCKWCDAAFRAVPPDAGHVPLYCSAACRKASSHQATVERAGLEPVECAGCGVRFDAVRGRGGQIRRYCGDECRTGAARQRGKAMVNA